MVPLPAARSAIIHWKSLLPQRHICPELQSLSAPPAKPGALIAVATTNAPASKYLIRIMSSERLGFQKPQRYTDKSLTVMDLLSAEQPRSTRGRGHAQTDRASLPQRIGTARKPTIGKVGCQDS